MNEIQVQASSGLTLYAVVRDPTGVDAYNTSTTALEAFNASNWTHYAIAMTNAGNGFYVANFPTAITTAGEFPIVVYTQAGGSPATSDQASFDGYVNWNGIAQDFGATGIDLISVSYAKLICNITVTTYDTVLAALVDAASQSVIDYCNNAFNLNTYNELYDLTRTVLELPLKHRPVVSLTSITLWPDSNNAEVIAGSNYIIDNGSGIIRFDSTASTSCSAFFPAGFGCVQAIYTAGGTVPTSVQFVTATIVNRMFKAMGKDTTLDSEHLEDYDYKNRADAFTFLTADLKKMLDPYCRYYV